MTAKDGDDVVQVERWPLDEEPVDVRARRRLRELRGERGLTLQQVAERANIDVSTLSRLEAGKRRLALDHLPRRDASPLVRAHDARRAASVDLRLHPVAFRDRIGLAQGLG